TPIIWRSRDEGGARPAQAPSRNWKTYYAQFPTQPQKAHRSAVENHVHRPPRLGSRRSLNLRIGIITGTQGGLITSAGLAVRLWLTRERQSSVRARKQRAQVLLDGGRKSPELPAQRARRLPRTPKQFHHC